YLMAFEDRYTPTDDPSIYETPASSFGGPEDVASGQDNGYFAFGCRSVMEDGSINPEPYASFPRSAYERGLVKPGQVVQIGNPANGKIMNVIARDLGPSAKHRGLDVAPHVLSELGANTDD